jgi:hypothetical protein
MAKRFRRDPTVLDVARAIADAVLKTRFDARRRDSTRDQATNAVIDTLHKTRTWLHHADFDEDGVAISGTERKLK